jgi:hypothetical protein
MVPARLYHSFAKKGALKWRIRRANLPEPRTLQTFPFGSVRICRLGTMSDDFRTCELCEVTYNAPAFNVVNNPHRCDPGALAARIVSLKDALRSERKRWQPKQGCGHAFDCAVHNAPTLPSGPCDCGAGKDAIEMPAQAYALNR